MSTRFRAQASFRCREKGDNAIILERINTNTGVITVQLTGQEEVVIFPQSTDILTKCREGTKREVFEKKKKRKERKRKKSVVESLTGEQTKTRISRIFSPSFTLDTRINGGGRICMKLETFRNSCVWPRYEIAKDFPRRRPPANTSKISLFIQRTCPSNALPSPRKVANGFLILIYLQKSAIKIR